MHVKKQQGARSAMPQSKGVAALKTAGSSLRGCQVLPVPDEWALSSPDALAIVCEHLACRHKDWNAVVSWLSRPHTSSAISPEVLVQVQNFLASVFSASAVLAAKALGDCR